MASLEFITMNKDKELVKKYAVSAVGLLVSYAGSNTPEHTLLCNGATISRTVYSELFAAIGTTYGAGDGSTTFNLPDITDRVLQGSETAGTVQDAGLPNIEGQLKIVSSYSGASWRTVENAGALAPLEWGVFAEATATYTTNADTGIKMNAHNSNAIYGNSTTVQPPAITARICIIYE